MRTILQINTHVSNFTSTGKQVLGLHDFYLKNNLNSIICYSNTDDCSNIKGAFCFGNKLDKYMSALLTRVFGNRYGHALFSTSKLLRYIKTIRPDIVHIHCINAYDVNIKKLFKFLGKKNIPVIITEHAEFFHTGNCSHTYDCGKYKKICDNCPNVFFATKSYLNKNTKRNQKRMKNSLDFVNNKKIVCVSPWLANKANESFILNGNIAENIPNGIDTEIFKYNNIEKKKQFIFVSSDPKTSNKGLHYLLEIAKKIPSYTFKVVGIVREQIINKEALKNVEFIGRVSDQKRLAELYSESTATLVLSKVETFGMAVAESLCCGTPVYGFLSGGPETIAIQKYSTFVDYGNTDELIAELRAINNNIRPTTISSEAQQFFSFEKIGNKYLQLINQLLRNKK